MAAIIIKEIYIDNDLIGYDADIRGVQLKAYYIDDDKKHKIVFIKEGNIPIGLLRKDEPAYPFLFGQSVVCINGLDINDIKTDNCDDYEFKIIRHCLYCDRSANINYPNYDGLCNCECTCCNDKLINCNCIPEGYGECLCRIQPDCIPEDYGEYYK